MAGDGHARRTRGRRVHAVADHRRTGPCVPRRRSSCSTCGTTGGPAPRSSGSVQRGDPHDARPSPRRRGADPGRVLVRRRSPGRGVPRRRPRAHPGGRHRARRGRSRDADAAVVVVGLNQDWETEGEDRTTTLLPGRQIELIEAVAAANPRTIVLVNAGSPVDMAVGRQVAAVCPALVPRPGDRRCRRRPPGGRPLPQRTAPDDVRDAGVGPPVDAQLPRRVRPGPLRRRALRRLPRLRPPRHRAPLLLRPRL